MYSRNVCFWFTWVLSSSGYDAIAYYDTDIEFQGDITPVLRCAASGKFLSTNGGAALSNWNFVIWVQELGEKHHHLPSCKLT